MYAYSIRLYLKLVNNKYVQQSHELRLMLWEIFEIINDFFKNGINNKLN